MRRSATLPPPPGHTQEVQGQGNWLAVEVSRRKSDPFTEDNGVICYGVYFNGEGLGGILHRARLRRALGDTSQRVSILHLVALCPVD